MPQVPIGGGPPIDSVFFASFEVAEDPACLVKERLTVGPNVDRTVGSQGDDGCGKLSPG